MKARTLIITTGAFAALVAGTVQPAGAKVSACALSGGKVSDLGYVGSGWSYPTSVKKVLVTGNGTRAPYYVFVGLGCGVQKAAPRIVHHIRQAPSAATAASGNGSPVSADACRFTEEGADVYIATGVLVCAARSEG